MPDKAMESICLLSKGEKYEGVPHNM